MYLTRLIRALNAIPQMWGREEKLESDGFVRIGAGCFKTVYGHPEHNFVVKVHDATDEYGYGGTYEVENYKRAPEHLKPHLLRVIQCRGFQIQKRVELRECPSTCPGEIDGMTDSWSSDEKRNHSHDLDGNLVIMDYGQRNQWDPYYRAAKVNAAYVGSSNRYDATMEEEEFSE
jgi:hypothetical protein